MEFIWTYKSRKQRRHSRPRIRAFAQCTFYDDRHLLECSSWNSVILAGALFVLKALIWDSGIICEHKQRH